MGVAAPTWVSRSFSSLVIIPYLFSPSIRSIIVWCGAAEHGKHVICEKPMALSMEQAGQMVETADKNNVKLVCGHTYSLNPSVQAMKRVARSGELGRVIQMANWLYSDWLLKPRMPEEL